MTGMHVWLPAVRVRAGVDVFTARLAALLRGAGIEVTLSWLPRWLEFVPELAAARPPAGTRVIHANSWNAFAFGGGVPLVTTVHHCVHDPAWAAHRGFAAGLYHRWRIRSLERRSLEAAAAVTAVSEFTRRGVLAAFGPRPIEVIPNWVDTALYSPRPAPVARGRAFRLLFAGNWGARKGTELLPGLMRRLGEGYELTYTAGLRGTVPSAAFPDNMRAAAAAADDAAMVELYRSCDAVVVPSRLEGFGYVVLEAMACGKPVVAFRAAALPELVEDGVTGRLVPPDDTSALAAACRELAETPRLAQDLGAAARERVLARFSAGTALGRYRRLYERLLARE